jgi:hypothetical protein
MAWQLKNYFLLITFWSYIYIISQRQKVTKKSQNSRNHGFSYFFCLIKDPDPEHPYLILMDPNPGGQKTYGSATLSIKVWILLDPDPKLHLMRILIIIIMFACFFTPNAFGVARWNCWASSVWMSARRPCRWLKLVSGTSTTAPVIEQRFLITGTTDTTDATASVSDTYIPDTGS